MAELMTGNLIKIIIGVIVVVVVIVGISIFFGAKVISFFKNLFEPAEILLGVLMG
jgi:hypothetical protein